MPTIKAKPSSSHASATGAATAASSSKPSTKKPASATKKPGTTVAPGLAPTAPAAKAKDTSGASLAQAIAKKSKDVKAVDVLSKPTRSTSTSVHYDLGARVLKPGQALYFAVPEQLRDETLSMVILGHRGNPEHDTNPDKSDKHDSTPALSSVQVYGEGFPASKAWRYWLGSSSGESGGKFAEVGYSMELENLYEWPKLGSGSVADGSYSDAPVKPQVFRVVSVGDDPVEIGEVTLKVVPRKPTKTLEAVFSKGTDLGDPQTGEGRTYGGGQSFQGLFPGALELGGWGATGGATKLPAGWKVNGGSLEISLPAGKTITSVDIACGDSHPDKITNSDGGWGTKGWAKLSIGLARADGTTDWFMSYENVPPEGVMSGSPTNGKYVTKPGDKIVVRASSDTIYVMAARVGLR